MIKRSESETFNAMGTIIGAVGCTPDCSENPVTSIPYCQNKGTVQVRYQLDSEPDWIVDNITPPFICSSDPCCSTLIAVGTTIYLRVDEGKVKEVDVDRNALAQTLFVMGVGAIVASSLLLLWVVGLAIYYARKRSAYTTV